MINPKIPSTIDAAALCKMADRGQITGGILDGPLAFDNAISAQAAKIKGITSPVSGDVDILLAPDLEAANMLFKQLTYLAGAKGQGSCWGPRSPSSSQAVPIRSGRGSPRWRSWCRSPTRGEAESTRQSERHMGRVPVCPDRVSFTGGLRRHEQG